MRKIDQTLFGSKEGNCFAACISMLMGLPLETIPNFCLYNDWHKQVNLWLKVHGRIYVEIKDPYWSFQHLTSELACIATGKSPRGDFNHCVVGHIYQCGDDIKFRLFHDPHPDRNDILNIQAVGFLMGLP